MSPKGNILDSFRYYLIHVLWNPNAKKNNITYRFILRPLRIFFITIKGFFEDKVQIQASALTYNTLMSIIPFLALAFGIAQGFGLQRKLESQLTRYFIDQQQALMLILTFVRKLLYHVKGGVIAGVGIILLLWSAMRVLYSVENAFNNIWQIKKARPWHRKFKDYLSIILIAPVVFLTSSSITVLITKYIHSYMEYIHFPDIIEWFIHLGIEITPFILLWGVFCFIYMIFPNTKVRFKSALVAGIIAGSIFQLIQWGYFQFQIKLSHYGAIYGSFAALPLFMMWLQISWIVLLFGAEFSFAMQNIENFEDEKEAANLSMQQKIITTLLIMHLLIKNFELGKNAFTAKQIAITLNLPIRLVHELIFELQKTGIITETILSEDEINAYQPAMDIQMITIRMIVEKLEQQGETSIRFDSTNSDKLVNTFEKFNELLRNNDANVLLKDI